MKKYFIFKEGLLDHIYFHFSLFTFHFSLFTFHFLLFTSFHFIPLHSTSFFHSSRPYFIPLLQLPVDLTGTDVVFVCVVNINFH